MGTSESERARITQEFLKVVEQERVLAAEAKGRAASPPVSSLGVLYHEIAEQDGRHVTVMETVAIRYGHTPSRFSGGGMVETLGRLKDRVSNMGAGATDVIWQDLKAKAEVIQAITQWRDTFQSLGDAESAAELAVLITEDQAQYEALFDALKHMAEGGVPASEAR